MGQADAKLKLMNSYIGNSDTVYAAYTLGKILHVGRRFRIVQAKTSSGLDVVLKFSAPPVPFVTSELRKALAWEASVLSAVAHPGFVRLIEFDLAYNYLVLEHLAGGSLLDSWSGNNRSGAFQCAVRIAEALHALHSVGYLHLDLKPRNVVFRDLTLSDPVIVDFGGARPLDRPILPDTIDTTMLGSGTYLFKAPEQIVGITKRFSPQTDGFALGVTLYWLLFGTTPYSNSEITLNSMRRKYQQEYERALERCTTAKLPKPAIDFLERMLVFEMDKRELSLDQIATQLRLCG